MHGLVFNFFAAKMKKCVFGGWERLAAEPLKRGNQKHSSLSFDVFFFAPSSLPLAFLAQKFLVGTHFCLALSWVLGEHSLRHPQSPPSAAFTQA